MSRTAERRKYRNNPEKLAELERCWKLRDAAKAKLREERRAVVSAGFAEERAFARKHYAEGKNPIWANFVDENGDYGGRATFAFVRKVLAGEVGELDSSGVRWFSLKKKPGRKFKLGPLREGRRSGLAAMSEESFAEARRNRGNSRHKAVRESREAWDLKIQETLRLIESHLGAIKEEAEKPFNSDLKRLVLERTARFWRGYKYALTYQECEPREFSEVHDEITRHANESAALYENIRVKMIGRSQLAYDASTKAERERVFELSLRFVPETYLTSHKRAKAVEGPKRKRGEPAILSPNDYRTKARNAMRDGLVNAARTMTPEEFDAWEPEYRKALGVMGKCAKLDYDRAVRKAVDMLCYECVDRGVLNLRGTINWRRKREGIRSSAGKVDDFETISLLDSDAASCRLLEGAAPSGARRARWYEN